MFSKKNFLILEIFYFSLLLLGKIQCRTLLIKNSSNESDELSIKCPILTECPLKPEFCQDDVNCNPDAVCCASPCGKICTQQLFTGCQTLRMATTRRAKSLGVSGKSLRMPRCTKQGNFEEIQCNNEIINSNCWCVDQVGFEVAGTRAPTRNLVNCTAQKNRCAEATCRMFCPWGFALTADGCPKCQCRDPCDEIQCPNALECHLEELSCADPPCPPVPTCKKGRSLENLCPVGDPLRINETIRPFLCGNDVGKPTCPPLYQCLVQTGNEYGVCCPNSLKIQKTGQCPAKTELKTCGMPCVHDLECPSIQKCCGNENCGQHQSHCTHPENVTECFHQRKLAELLSVNEQIGRGYLPQCLENGEFAARQCSRNNLVCWCVDDMGNKIKGSMGAPETVNCQNVSMIEPAHARALQCVVTAECPAICEYGFRLDENGCPTCKCDNPCDGFRCPEDEECVAVRKDTCDDFLCPALPVCRPKAIYANPCDSGTPLTDSSTGAPVACALKQNETGKICPEFFECTSVLGSTQSVCCPTVMENPEESAPSSQTMCQYLRDFHDSMEGTSAEMSLALSIPQCDHLGNFQPTQCDEKSSDCWCVDNYGTEIPNTRSSTNSSNCLEIRSTMDCLDGSCRLGCDYGFILSKETGCPTCQCRDPCSDVKCQNNQQCQLVEVNCSDHYCPPVPACLPKKTGQCPYLVPVGSAASCDLECHSDLTCDGTMKCCSNGCGTQCTEPLNLTTCQHQKLIGQHRAHDQGIPEGKLYIPQCDATGNFKRQQCHLGNKECWCVDENGFELSKTRTRVYNNLTCDNALVSQSTEQCPLWECKRDCAHGYEFDEKGCRMCSCTDPCRNISCRNPGESCRLVDVECVTSPCPAIPMCLPEKTNPCQFGAPLKLNQGELFVCGPQNEENLCPSSHKCEISPVGEYAVCCPKPRTVCFEPMNSGDCRNGEEIKNLTRFYFNSRINKCEMFNYSGCEGNHNNFHNLKICEAVCPVLSQCERLREKNQHLSEKYKKPTFVPRCDQETGNWEKIQCLDHVGVCWCATPKGETLKGTLTRSAEPECNFRQARNRKMLSEADLVLDELINQLASLDEINEKSADDSIPEETSIDRNDRPEVNFSLTRCESLGGQCDKDGKFLPTQCEETVCWCVDEAGNQLAETVTFEISQKTCFPKPVEKVEITLGILGQFTDVTVVPIINEINELILKQLNGFMEEIRSEFENNLLFIKFALIGYNKIDVAYKFEQLVMSQKLGLTIDLTKYRVNYKPLLSEIDATTKGEILPLQQREILTNSPVSFVAPYHTALIILAAASAFIISILLVLVLLYRRKVNHIIDEKEKLSSIRRISIEKSAKIHEEFQEKCV